MKLVTSSSRVRRARAPWRFVAVAIVLSGAAALPACSGRTEPRATANDDQRPIAVCDEYAGAYARCLDRLGPHLGEQRGAELRTAFEATRDARSREVLEKQCTDSLARLKVACP